MTTTIFIVSMYLGTIASMYLLIFSGCWIGDRLIHLYNSYRDRPRIMIDDEGKEWLVGYFDFPSKK